MNLKDYKTHFSERLSHILETFSVNAHSFEQRCGLKLGVIQKAISNKGTISAEAISKILLTYGNLNPYWLMTGKESIYRESNRDGYNVLHEEKAEYMSMARLKKENEVERLKDIVDLQKYKISNLESKLKEKEI